MEPGLNSQNSNNTYDWKSFAIKYYELLQIGGKRSLDYLQFLNWVEQYTAHVINQLVGTKSDRCNCINESEIPSATSPLHLASMTPCCSSKTQFSWFSQLPFYLTLLRQSLLLYFLWLVQRFLTLKYDKSDHKVIIYYHRKGTKDSFTINWLIGKVTKKSRWCLTSCADEISHPGVSHAKTHQGWWLTEPNLDPIFHGGSVISRQIIFSKETLVEYIYIWYILLKWMNGIH